MAHGYVPDLPTEPLLIWSSVFLIQCVPLARSAEANPLSSSGGPQGKDLKEITLYRETDLTAAANGDTWTPT